MLSGLSPEIVVWIVAVVTVIFLVTIWGLYKLYWFFKSRRDAAEINNLQAPDSLDSSNSQSDGYTILMKDDNPNINQTDPKVIDSDPLFSNKHAKLMQTRYPEPRKRYLEFNSSLDSRSNDKIIHDSLFKSSTSNKSAANRMKEMRSNSSRKSTGFEPTLTTVEPLIKGRRSSNFLEILDRLNAEEDEEEEKEELERRRRKRESIFNNVYTVSSAGIEANSSDETASQTFIGKEPETRPDPGRIHLGLIKARDAPPEKSIK